MPDPRHSYTVLAPKIGRRRRAVWLLLGWLAFWAGTVAYPCQVHPALTHLVEPNAAFEVAAGQIADFAPPASHPAHDEGTCHHVCEPVIGAPLAAVTDSGNPNAEPVVAVALERYPTTAAVSVAGIRPISQAFPHTPLFLRTQRLLI